MELTSKLLLFYEFFLAFEPDQINSVLELMVFLSASLEEKRQMAAVNRNNQEEHSKNGVSVDTSIPAIVEEYIIFFRRN